MNQIRIDRISCDVEAGICEIPGRSYENSEANDTKPVKVLYFTDPICSSCWGIEAQLRKLKYAYGNYFEIEYRMGGLLKSWSEYGGSDVSGPHSVAQHWDEAGAYYEMPINGDLWLEDPLHSSYPPSIAFKAAQMQDTHKADLFLRRIKEMVFTEKKNIESRENLLQAANSVSLNSDQLQYDMEHKAKQLFQEDLLMAKEWGVKGFPTIYFIDRDDNRFKVYGSKPYKVYEQALLKLLSDEVRKEHPSSFKTIFDAYDSITLKEFSVFYEKSFDESESILKQLEQENKIRKIITEAGPLWKLQA